jgi:hypothetical protein
MFADSAKCVFTVSLTLGLFTGKLITTGLSLFSGEEGGTHWQQGEAHCTLRPSR